jgi:competence protein ComEA
MANKLFSKENLPENILRTAVGAAIIVSAIVNIIPEKSSVTVTESSSSSESAEAEYAENIDDVVIPAVSAAEISTSASQNEAASEAETAVQTTEVAQPVPEQSEETISTIVEENAAAPRQTAVTETAQTTAAKAVQAEPQTAATQTTAPQTTAPQTTAAQTTQANSGLININTASLSLLTTLNGIGDVKGQAIIDYRNEHGAFTSVDELINVKGIGEKTLAKIRSYITV